MRRHLFIGATHAANEEFFFEIETMRQPIGLVGCRADSSGASCSGANRAFNEA